MALNNSQYNIIMRIYDKRQQANRHNRERRIEEVYSAVPRIREIDASISSVAVSRAKELLFGGCETARSLQLSESMQQLIQEKNDLLEANGFSPDYMEPVYDCNACKDTGYIGDEKCRCFKQAVIDMLYTQSNLKQILCRENFDTFSFSYYNDDIPNPVNNLTPYQNIRKVYSLCREFIDNFDTSFQNILFYGDTGTGKTFLSNCIANELLQRSKSVIYLTAISLFDLFSKQAFSNDADDIITSKDLEQYLFDCDLLIIDDLGTESPNSFTNSKLFYCLNERFLREKSTIISTNLSLEMINSLYSERIYSRLVSNYTLLKLFGDDIRIKKKLNNLSLD